MKILARKAAKFFLAPGDVITLMTDGKAIVSHTAAEGLRIEEAVIIETEFEGKPAIGGLFVGGGV